ncbi:MAG: hypothetical protein HQL33_06235 [Alphaproteobacteria bacterium]|nr:hypothetical protein [Alphaproteobacteria bacterium]
MKYTAQTLTTKEYEERIVIFIDILGFRNFVANTNDDILKIFVSKLKNMTSDGEIGTNGNSLYFLPSVIQFSDTIIASAPVNYFKIIGHPTGANILLYISVWTSKIQMHALEFGLLTRGCVAFGKSFNDGSAWFGPAIIDAYEHESNYAIYPRIIISDSLTKQIRIDVDQKQDYPLLTHSDDGFYYVNFFGWSHINFEDKPAFVVAHNRVREMIEKGMSSCRDLKHKIKWRWFAVSYNNYTEKHLLKSGKSDSEYKFIPL